ncbi:putative quinol monooxygenase [Synechocystis sp. PCC 7509]|uniref:putative quinol monooxygenase n=1 Tax=Synechocystis sp. PCC 7509 TaxID=927677 RepID=UPI0002ABA8F0|nr:putative quinol monooxygenase [Synechocystis sp. PCC 7509]
MYLITGNFRAKADKREELIQLAHSMFAPSRAEAGCISYNLYEDSSNKNCFLFFEEWQAQAAIDKHFQTLHFQDFMQKFSGMIEGEPTIKIHEVKETKQL